MTAPNERDQIAELLAKRYTFDSFADVQPGELKVIIINDADAIAEWLRLRDLIRDEAIHAELNKGLEELAARVRRQDLGYG